MATEAALACSKDREALPRTADAGLKERHADELDRIFCAQEAGAASSPPGSSPAPTSEAASAPCGTLQGPCLRADTSLHYLWSWDWIAEFTQRGGKLRLFNLIEQYTSQCH